MRRILLLLAAFSLACDEPSLRPVAVPAAHASTTSSDEVRPPLVEDLERYTAGISGSGALHARISTNMGAIDCELFEADAPLAVANFVGLARGLHPWADPTTKRAVTDRPFYENVVFHRVVRDFVVQSGDREGTGLNGPGYTFADELDANLKFDRPGRLAMANVGPDTNGSQFFVALDRITSRNGKDTIFGQCDPTVPRRIGSVAVTRGEQGDSRPASPVVIQSVRFERR